MPVPLTYHTSAIRETPESRHAAGPSQLSTGRRSAGESVLVQMTVAGAGSPDLTRDLFNWLNAEPDLRGWVHIIEGDPPTYALGTAEVVLEAALGPGGAVTAVVTGTIAWLRLRRGKVTISFSSSDGNRHRRLSITTAVAKLDAKGVRDLVTQASAVLVDGCTSGDADKCAGAQNNAA